MKETIIIYKNTLNKSKDLGLDIFGYDILILVALNNILNKYRQKDFITFEHLSYFVSSDYNISKRMKENYIQAIRSLDGKVINIIEEDKRGFLIDYTLLNCLFKDSKYYNKLDIKDFQTMAKESVQIFNYYIKMCQELETYIYFNYSIEQISERFQINRKTVIKYNKFLSENKIIYIYQYNFIYVNSGLKLNNMYGFYENKSDIIQNAKEYLKSNKNNIKSISNNAKIAENQPYDKSINNDYTDYNFNELNPDEIF